MHSDESSTEREEWSLSCWDCEREFERRDLQHRNVIDTSGPGMGYEEITVPICSDCIGRRFGFECPNCGIKHSEKDDARYCCQRRPGESPDCPDCGRRMDRVSHGYDPVDGQTCEVAECPDCGIMWGKYTGFEEK